jgi:nucleoid-associated protein YgaU
LQRDRQVPVIAPPSRFVLTPTRVDDAAAPGRLRFELWRPPEIDMSSYTQHTVTIADRGRLDLIAYKLLGDARLWWAIAHANNIADPLAAIDVGTTLRIPTLEAIMASLASGERGE